MGKAALRFIIMIVAVIMLFSWLNNRPGPLASKITKYADENYKEEGIEIRLSDFTNFEWDKVLVFRYPTSQAEIQDAIGIEYNKSLDLMSGLIFVNDGKFLRDEIFKYEYTDKIAPFVIFPHQDINQKPKFSAFTKEKAVFLCEKSPVEYLPHFYSLYPSD